jgi:hypothetical protein
MLAHLYLDFLDSANPSSLSPTVVEYVRSLDSEVLIVSDDMHMLDASGFDRHTALKSALVAGLDVIIYSLPISESTDILSYAESLLNDGTITIEEVDEHVMRILETKAGIVNDDINVVPFHLVNRVTCLLKLNICSLKNLPHYLRSWKLQLVEIL